MSSAFSTVSQAAPASARPRSFSDTHAQSRWSSLAAVHIENTIVESKEGEVVSDVASTVSTEVDMSARGSQNWSDESASDSEGCSNAVHVAPPTMVMCPVQVSCQMPMMNCVMVQPMGFVQQSPAVFFVPQHADAAFAQPQGFSIAAQPHTVEQTMDVRPPLARPQRSSRRRAAKPEPTSTGKNHSSALAGASKPTTVMLRNLPNNLTRSALLDLLTGFEFDFVYLPVDFERSANLGYAFVNLCHHEASAAFFAKMNGFKGWPGSSRKVCEVLWNENLQGLAECVAKFRNSPLMHPSVPAEHRPMLFEQGRPVAFPPPTKSLRAPRLRSKRQ